MTAARPVVVIGAGGCGRETTDLLRAAGRIVRGVVDDTLTAEASALLCRLEVAYLGSLDEWLATAPDDDHVIAVNAPATRRRIAGQMAGSDSRATTVVHPSAEMGSLVVLGPGVMIGPGVTIGSNAHLGSHVHCNAGVVIGHDVRIDDHTSLNPRATISGTVSIGAGTLIGAGAVILQTRRIGADAVVGAAACVTRDVPARTTVVGVPATADRPSRSAIPECYVPHDERTPS